MMQSGHCPRLRQLGSSNLDLNVFEMTNELWLKDKMRNEAQDPVICIRTKWCERVWRQKTLHNGAKQSLLSSFDCVPSQALPKLIPSNRSVIWGRMHSHKNQACQTSPCNFQSVFFHSASCLLRSNNIWLWPLSQNVIQQGTLN